MYQNVDPSKVGFNLLYRCFNGFFVGDVNLIYTAFVALAV